MRQTLRPSTPTDLWRKPQRVTLEEGYLVAADFETCPTYPLQEAAQEGRALRALIEARTEDQVCQFTKNWGFLHHRVEQGRRDRFPVALFRIHQRHFLALARLCVAVRTRPNDRSETATALGALKTSRDARAAYLYPPAGARRDAVRDASPSIGVAGMRTLEECLTNPERALVDQGVPILVLLAARTEGGRMLSLGEYAARTIASEVSSDLQSKWCPVWQTAGRRPQHGYWTFEEIPIVHALEQVLRWTVRSRYQVLNHYFCEGCGGESTSWRADARFCSEECGTRARVQRFRRKRGRR